MRARIRGAPQRWAYAVLALTCSTILTGCPPLVVRFRPERLIDVSNHAVANHDQRFVIVRSHGITLSIEGMDEVAGYLHARLAVMSGAQFPITLRTRDLYVTSDGNERFGLYALQYRIDSESYFVYRGGEGESRLEETYELPSSTQTVRLTFLTSGQAWPEEVTLHLEGIKLGGEEVRIVYRYRVDCDALSREMPWFQRWFGIGAFAYYCRS